MTDLVQKIVDAVNAAWDAWADDTNDERPFIVVQREAIRHALADAGGAVAWMIDGEPMLEHEVRSTDAESRNDLLARAIPLFLHPAPDAGRVAELEAQLAESREREGRMREAAGKVCRRFDNFASDAVIANQLHPSRLLGAQEKLIEALRELAALAADQEKNDE